MNERERRPPRFSLRSLPVISFLLAVQVWVADRGNKRLQVFHGDTGEWLGAWTDCFVEEGPSSVRYRRLGVSACGRVGSASGPPGSWLRVQNSHREPHAAAEREGTRGRAGGKQVCKEHAVMRHVRESDSDKPGTVCPRLPRWCVPDRPAALTPCA